MWRIGLDASTRPSPWWEKYRRRWKNLQAFAVHLLCASLVQRGCQKERDSVLTLLHTADWQIGKQFGQFESDDAVLLAEARFRVVENIAHIAQQQDAALILVAGDVFDAQTVSDKTIHKLFNAMQGFRGSWVLIPGNHDAGLSESVWTRAARLNALAHNIHVCLTPEPLLLESLHVAILPAPLLQRHTHVDLTEWFASAATPAHMYRIGLGHGCVQGILAEDIDSSNPIAAGRANQANLDYLALGDWHGTKQIDARTWYSGTPETDRFRANESGQVLRVDIAAPGTLPVVTRVPVGRYRWQSHAWTVEVASDVDEIAGRLAGFSANDVIQLNIAGQTDLAGFRRIESLMAQTRGRCRGFLAELSALRLEPTMEDVEALRADGYLGEVVAALRADQIGPNAALARDALVELARILDQRRADGGAGGGR